MNVYLHGATGAAEPVLPTVFNLIATWGPAEVTLDGEPFENPYDGPTPMWVTHTMTTPGVRDPDGAVRMANGDIYSPELRDQDPANDYDDLEFHDLPGPDSTESFPPATSFFYHLSFEDVVVEIHHAGGSEMEMME